MRQIVAGLTGDTEGCIDLANELSRADPVTLEMQDSEDEGSDPEDWLPDPTDAVKGQYARTPNPSAPSLRILYYLLPDWLTTLVHLAQRLECMPSSPPGVVGSRPRSGADVAWENRHSIW